jgi:hypothetical protein
MNSENTAYLNRHRGPHHRASVLSFAALPSLHRGHPGRCSIASHVVTLGGLRCGYDREQERAREIAWLCTAVSFGIIARTKLGGMLPRSDFAPPARFAGAGKGRLCR